MDEPPKVKEGLARFVPMGKLSLPCSVSKMHLINQAIFIELPDGRFTCIDGGEWTGTDIDGIIDGYNITAPKMAYALVVLGWCTRNDYDEWYRWWHETNARIEHEEAVSSLERQAFELGFELVSRTESAKGHRDDDHQTQPRRDR